MVLTVEARVRVVHWDMGDGTTVDCFTSGTPYHAGYGLTRSPDCGHVYHHASRREPDRRFPVTATTVWEVTWEIDEFGVGETLTTERESTTSVEIRELQVLVGGATP